MLTHLAGNLEGPCVLAVDAAWGTGKTTFIGMWSQHLRNQGFPVVPFNAWETDFSGDPFLTLTSELTEGLHEYPGEPLATKIADTKKKAKEVIQWAVPGAIRLATAAIPVVGSELGQTLASYAEGKLSDYQESQKSIKAFRRVLHDMASELSAQKGHPLIVVIDELDRCRPSYAVELLEVAKHLFSVDHIVFVLAVNRSELAHSIRALYGNDLTPWDICAGSSMWISGFPTLNEPRLSTRCLVRYRLTTTSVGQRIDALRGTAKSFETCCWDSSVRLTSAFGRSHRPSTAWDWSSRHCAAINGRSLFRRLLRLSFGR